MKVNLVLRNVKWEVSSLEVEVQMNNTESLLYQRAK
jgi:hypothetical protein